MTLDRKHILEEWANIRKAPLSFVISILIASAIIWFILDQYVYKTRLDSKNAEIQLLQRQLDIYKDKKYIIGETTFSKLTNKQLKEKAVQKQNIMLSIYQDYKNLDTLRHYSKNLKWEEMTKLLDKQGLFGNQMIRDYEINHKVEVILLREQILLRLPKEEAKKSDFHYYEHPTNPIGYKMMLDDFSRLILNLSDE